jgi:hypothetical protein
MRFSALQRLVALVGHTVALPLAPKIEACGTDRLRILGDISLDILDIVQTCPKCPKWVVSEKPRKFGTSEFHKFGTRLASKRVGIRADPDSSRHDLGVAIASVALPKRERARSLKPR